MVDFISEIKIRGVDLEVFGSPVRHQRAAITADPATSVPPSGGYIDDLKVTIAGLDVTDLLDPKVLDAIETNVLEACS